MFTFQLCCIIENVLLDARSPAKQRAISRTYKYQPPVPTRINLSPSAMGCSPSTLAVAALNRSLETGEGPDVLQSKLQTSPWLLSATTAVLSSTAGTPLHTACERKQVEVVQQMLSFLSGASLSVVREALQPYCRRNDLPLPHSVAEGVRIAVGMVNCKGGPDAPHVRVCGWQSRAGQTANGAAALLGSPSGLTLPPGASEPSRAGVRYVNVRTSSGLSALHYAAFFDHPAAVEELLRHDPHINAATSSHSYDVDTSCDALSTPLHFAAVLHPTTPGGTRARDPRLRANHGHRTPWQVAVDHHPEQRELLQLLHPGTPLEEVVELLAASGTGAAAGGAPSSSASASQQQLLPLSLLPPFGGGMGARTGPASLASIAAAALQTRLLGELQRLLLPPSPPLQLLLQQKQQQQEGSSSPHVLQLGSKAVTGSSSGSSRSEARATGPVGDVEVRGRRRGKGALVAEAVEEEEEEAEEVFCGVCFVEREAVAPAGCGHGVCGRCAERMCRMALGPGSSKPPRPLLCPFCRREVTGFVGLAAREVRQSGWGRHPCKHVRNIARKVTRYCGADIPIGSLSATEIYRCMEIYVIVCPKYGLKYGL
ncbi:hypothetical protein VOLCADRAFT_99616 [Volvox carteri f. nagariensis]|uniref:RING-type domain-containing protein n=1 Tax=Volvox carteri f. nagariensis TaxID=3068 RepID=D8UI84_VOLCA|nr:uncharacterized protein VOLCADRAFT_99616 [Volvox carteri f. nagariensis]EFJ40568.1 hypothetical protein VOLCADRAFT_99616 [Volvox carteri f. nagariensis]|eukprot:XP_002958346.1 hypothetical protein VOLCADRAFT_99616 [Volvox carteri f. nagariensis]